METAADRGPPAGIADPKRPNANVALRVDWHDYLISRREPGAAIALNQRVRPERAKATGLQYKCTTAGVASSWPWDRIRWPLTLGGTVTDGSAIWTAEAIDVNSQRLTISTDVWTADSNITLATQSNADLVYTTYASGGSDSQQYEIRHKVTLSNGEIAEALILLPVKD
jgi:hypothetical protein